MKKKTTVRKKKSVPVCKVEVAAVTGARDYFASELRSVLEKRRIDAENNAFEYLVELLMRFMDTEAFFSKNAQGKLENHFLVGLHSEYVHGTPEVKRQALRRLGDVCLMVTGFFPDSLSRKLVDVDYYTGMGGAAYWELAQWQMGSPVFKELSVRFKTYSDVLCEMSSRSGLQSNTDLLRLYERWLHSGSDRLKEMLVAKGIDTPVRTDVKTRH